MTCVEMCWENTGEVEIGRDRLISGGIEEGFGDPQISTKRTIDFGISYQ